MTHSKRLYPWKSEISIYQHIASNIDSTTGKLSNNAQTLPDDERRFAKEKLRWVPGALEGALWYSSDDKDRIFKTQRVIELVINIAQKDSSEDKRALYSELSDDSLLGFIDLALDKIVDLGIPAEPYLHKFVLFLAKEASDRGVVKFAIALLGVMADPSDRNIILILGKHEEFTLYTAIALEKMLEDPADELWDLAQKVDGWGKIQVVRCLAKHAESPNIKSWLIREGFRNTVMNEYLALTCAIQGNLKEAMLSGEIDDDLSDACGEIISDLITGTPNEDINHYEDARIVVAAYLDHLMHKTHTLKHFSIINSILYYLKDEEWDSLARQKNGWSEEVKMNSLQLAESIINEQHWSSLINKGLETEDKYEFHLASHAASQLGIDTWQVHWNRLQAEPLDSRRWYRVMRKVKLETIDQVLEFAQKVLPLEQVATGPADELGLGPQYKIHQCMDCILQDLRRFPGYGWPFVKAGLKSPAVRNRNMALKVLSLWQPESWTIEIESTLAEAFDNEPRDDVKERIGRVLRGEPLNRNEENNK